MLDKFDYAEPSCPLCDGKDFYYPQKDAPLGSIPVGRVIDKVDAMLARNDYAEAGRLLTYWRDEAVALRDPEGELAMENELVGYYRKQNESEKGLASISRALTLVKELKQGEMASGATVFVNCATAYRAFGMLEKALPLYRSAQEVYNNVLDSTDARFGALYNNMSMTLSELGELDEAEKACFSALSIMENLSGGEAEAAITYINLAHIYEAADKTSKIEGCMVRAYRLLKSDKLAHDGYYAFVLEKCAPSFAYFGDEKICDELTREAEAIYERS